MTQRVDAASPFAEGPVERGAGALQTAASRTQQSVGAGMLLTGIAALALTDVLFAIATAWVFWLLMGGVLLVGEGWLTLAVLGARRLLAATALVAVSYFALTALAPATRALSWRMLVAMHREELAAAVRLLEPVGMEQELYGRRSDPTCTRLPGLPASDCPALQAAMSGFGAHDTWKEGTVTVFETYLSFNARGGLMHCPAGDCGDAPGQRYPRSETRVTGDWYRWAQ